MGYDRQLDIANQPLLALQHAQNGSLLPQDVKTLNTLYPGLQKAIADRVIKQTIELQAKGKTLPYRQRISLQMLTGSSPMDGSMIPTHMQAIIQSQATQQQHNQARGNSMKSPSTQTQKTIDKTTQLYGTPLDYPHQKR